MTRVLSLCLVASLMLGTAFSQNTPGGAEPTLQAGIKEFSEGDLAGAVFTLEAVIRTLALEPALHAKELSRAYLYRGAAFVALGQEESAKGSFAAALRYDKELRITEDQFSPRVVRVFDAARQGKTKSVLLPPSKVAKKAGISALGIAGIVGGVLAVGGGAAVAVAHGSPGPTPTPTPTPVQAPLVTDTFKGVVTNAHGLFHDNYYVVGVHQAGTLEATLTWIVTDAEERYLYLSPDLRLYLYSGERNYGNGTGADTLAQLGNMSGNELKLSIPLGPGTYTLRVWSPQGQTWQANFVLEVRHP